MRFTKPAWVAHQETGDKKRASIFSINVHPDGSRIATGGLGEPTKPSKALVLLAHATVNKMVKFRYGQLFPFCAKSMTTQFLEWMILRLPLRSFARFRCMQVSTSVVLGRSIVVNQSCRSCSLC